MIKVSVILPIYNVGPYLDDAFKSLINQTLQDIEIIAVNDGATDNSQEYIDKYKTIDSRIKCIKQNNQGLSGARNTGMKYIQGEYVYFMDSDDILELNALEICYTNAKNNEADVCLFDADIFYEKNASTIPWDYDRSSALKEGNKYNGEEYLLIPEDKILAVIE